MQLAVNDLIHLGSLIVGFVSMITIMRYKVDKLARDIDGVGNKVGRVDRKMDELKVKFIEDSAELRLDIELMKVKHETKGCFTHNKRSDA